MALENQWAEVCIIVNKNSVWVVLFKFTGHRMMPTRIPQSPNMIRTSIGID